ncbi:hypothetical protein SUGI_1006000 [Cryptomeria japonica]|nr:hypothetical protein SUGI_1006000 [Cryptomeria japonica]
MALGLFKLVASLEDVPSWWIWAYWCSPLSDSQNALAVNEVFAPRWNKPSSTTSNETLGHAIIEARGLFAEARFYWIGIGSLIGFCVIFNILFTLALTVLNPFGKSQGVLSEDVIEKKHANRTGESSHGGKLMSVDASGKHSRGHAYSLERRESSNSEFHSIHDRELSELQASVPQKKGMVLPFQPLSMAFENINYYVDMPVV